MLCNSSLTIVWHFYLGHHGPKIMYCNGNHYKTRSDMQTYLNHCWHALNKNARPRKITWTPKIDGLLKAESPFPRGPPFSGVECYVFSGVCLHEDSRKQTGLAGTNNLWGGLGWHVAAPSTIAKHPIDPNWWSQIIPDRPAIGMRAVVFCLYVQLFSKDLGKVENTDNATYILF